MRKTMIMLCLAIVSWGASAQHDHSSMGNSGSSHSNMAPKMKGEARVIPSIKVNHSLSVTSILDNYLALKDALVDDNSKKAASSGKMLLDALGKFDLSSQPESKQKELKDILDDAKENAGHISENGDKIDHQREHFELLGGDLKDLIVIAGADRNLYQLFCSLYNNNKGGKWLSISDKVKNPLSGGENKKSGFTPESGTMGSSIILTGTNLNPEISKNTVRVNGLIATVTSASSRELKLFSKIRPE